MKKIQLIAISSATLLASSMSFAKTASVDIHISAQVPISCSANLNVNVVQISANEFKIGELDRFCNSPHIVNARSTTRITGTLRIDGQAASRNGDTSSLSIQSRAIRGGTDLLLSGVSNAEAQAFAGSLTISLSPIGT